MPDRMTERMSEYMPDRLPDRMPEYTNVCIYIHILQHDTKIEDIPPISLIILQTNFYLILGLAPQQKPNQIEDIL